MDFFSESEIESSIRRIDQLLSCGIFDPNNSGNILMRAAFIDLLISLRDLMFKCEKFSSRIDFTDDVPVEGKIKDVSDLIKYVRDALCHPDSDNHFIEKGNVRASFNIAFGKVVLMKMNDFEQSSLYADDICFFFGAKGIYMKRHIIRAFEEAKAKLEPLINKAR